jgi:Xaa-Pro aminopeptidase
MSAEAALLAGVPAINNTLYHAIRFKAGDPAALIEFTDSPRRGAVAPRRLLILRDIEMERARRTARVDAVRSPADFAPVGGLSGDRETATAQAVAECLRREGIARVRSDRTLSLSYLHELEAAGIAVEYDPLLGVAQRRAKDAQEVAWLRDAQAATEAAMAMACGMVAGARARSDRALELDGSPLTSERVMTAIDLFLLARGYSNPGSIVAGGLIGADCHDHGHGVLRSGEPVIIDIYPRSLASRYNGDCTRTVVHGAVPALLARMHAAVIDAKRAAIAAIRPGITGEAVHEATARVIRAHGFEMGMPPAGSAPTWCGMVHGTGHGIGLDVHEPPLLDRGGPELVVGDALTVEPGLYCGSIGGVRVEDLVVVTASGCENLNALPEGLTGW